MLKWGETRLPKLGVNMGKCGKSPLRGYWLYMVITCFGTSGGPNMDALPVLFELQARLARSIGKPL